MHYSQRLKERIAELEAETELLATQVQNKANDNDDLQEENAALTEIHGRVLKERDAYRQKLSVVTHECDSARNELVEAEKQLQGERGWRKFYGGLLLAAIVVVVALGSYCVVLKNAAPKAGYEVVQ